MKEILIRRKLTAVCAQFKREWSPEQRSDFARYLVQVYPDSRSKLLRALLKIDVELRKRSSLNVQASDYLELGDEAVETVKQLLERGYQIDSNSAREVELAQTASCSQDMIPAGVSLPCRIGNYLLVQKLGGGGMGDVYLAHHEKFGDRRFAIKLIRKSMLGPKAIHRFEKEIEAIGKLNHPNIVYAHDAGHAEQGPYLVMKYVDGMDLQSLVKTIGPLPIVDACEAIRQSAMALQHAFEHGLVHRDIKPSNLYLSASGQILLLDLGLAKFRKSLDKTSVTGFATIIGTPDFMAPEQWRDIRSVTIQSDIYSLGCTLYFLLSGRGPFQGGAYESVAAKMQAHLNEEPRRLETVIENLPAGLTKMLSKAMAKSPVRRFATPAELALALEKYATGSDLTSLLSAPKLPALSLVDTSKLHLTRSETIHAKAVNSRWAWISASILMVAVVIALSWSPIIAPMLGSRVIRAIPAVTTDLSDAEIHVALDVIAPEGSEYRRLGRFPDEWISFVLGFRSTIRATSSRECYLCLVGLNPAEGNKELIQVYYSTDEAGNQIKVADYQFPAQFDRSRFYAFTDGVGQQCIILIASPERFPDKDAVEATVLRAFNWTKTSQAGSFYFDGKHLIPIFERRTRGEDVLTSPRLDMGFRSLKEEFAGTQIRGLAFPIKSPTAGIQ